MLKFLYSRQMASYLQAMVRSLTRKQTFEVSLLPSIGILSPSIDKKFDEETNLWRFSLHLRYRPNTTKTSFEIWTSETRGGCLPFSKYQHLVKEDGLRILHCHPFAGVHINVFLQEFFSSSPAKCDNGIKSCKDFINYNISGAPKIRAFFDIYVSFTQERSRYQSLSF